MSNKQKRQSLHALIPSTTAVLLVIATLLLLIGLYSARQNNLTALRLRDQVLKADKENGDTEVALRTLRVYMYSHMNTELASGPSAIRPPIQLKYRYERLAAAEKERASKQNETIYNDAQKICEQRFPKGLSGSGRIPCIQEYVSSHGVKEQPVQDDLYKFDFASPKWSPDIAGIALLMSLIFFIIFAVRFSLDHWFKKQVSDRM